MSYTKECWIKCDTDGCIAKFGIGVSTAKETRKDARKNGWQCDSEGDYCPSHNDKRRR